MVLKDLINHLDIKNYKLQNNDEFSKCLHMSRSEERNNGGKVVSSISKKLDFLIVGDSKPTRKKLSRLSN